LKKSLTFYLFHEILHHQLMESLDMVTVYLTQDSPAILTFASEGNILVNAEIASQKLRELGYPETTTFLLSVA
jgi:hypothetical protein